MLAVERRNQILEKLQEEKKVIVSELSELFGVSEETIRRDLDRLDKEGLAVKSYGGAVLNESAGIDLPFQVRRKKNMAGKQRIGAIIAQLIQDGEHIILDPSTTAVAIVKALQHKQRLTVITNSIEVLVELADKSGWDIISSGGTLRENYLALVGPRAMEGIASFNADKAILSCKGIDMEKGITDANEMFSQVKQAMLSSASQRILAADHTKFDKVAFSRICEVTDIDMVVTDERPSEAWMEYFREKGIACLYEKKDGNHCFCE
ncbi:MAG: DeoR/GlpR family DNA-binding transcription regulator [Roseburia sp.]